MKITKEFKLGIIVIIAFIGFVALFLFFKGKDIFSNDNIYNVKYFNVSGLEPSKNVSINGLKVGTVESIIPVAIKNNLHFIVKLKVHKKYIISKDTEAQIFEPGIMSGSEIRLILGKDNDFARDYDTLKGSVSPSLTASFAQEIKPVKINLENVLKDLDSTLVSINKFLNSENRQNLGETIKSLNIAIDHYNNVAVSLNGLINNNSKKLETLLTTTNNTMEKYGTLADKINESEIEKIIANLNSTLDNVNQLTLTLNSTKGTAGRMINDPAVYNNLNQVTQNLNALLIDFKANPKRYVHFSIFGKKNLPAPLVVDTVYTIK